MFKAKKGGSFMITKRMYSRLLLCSASTVLLSAMAVAQYQPGGAGQQQPNTPTQQPTNPSTGTMGPDNNSLANQQATADQTFVRKALEGGAAEVQLGQLAQQKSQSEDVKKFAQKMVEDHTQLGEQMKPIAQQLGVKEPKGPSKKDKQLIAKLEGLSGPQFDEAYIQAMVKDHKEDLKEFKDEAQSALNQNVKQAAQQGAGVISEHLQMIQQIAQNHNVATDSKSKTSASMQ
jgi:putative membrane protein